MLSPCCTSTQWSSGRNFSTSISSLSFILPLLDCQPNLVSKWTIFGALPLVARIPLCVPECVCPTQDPIHGSSWDHQAPWTVSPPHQPKGTFPKPEHSNELVSTGSQTLAIILQITGLEKSLWSKMLVNKSLLLLWFTTFLRTLGVNFSTLLQLWGTADTVEPVSSRRQPWSPQSVLGSDSILCGSRGQGKTQCVTVHQGREGILGRVQSTFWSCPLSLAGAAKAVAQRRGRQPTAAGQAGREVLWAGKGEAVRLSCQMSLVVGSLCELQQTSHVFCAPVFLSGKGEDPLYFVAPCVPWSFIHRDLPINPLTTQMDTGTCNQLLQLQRAHAGEGSPLTIYSGCSASHRISVLKWAARDTCWFLKAI